MASIKIKIYCSCYKSQLHPGLQTTKKKNGFEVILTAPEIFQWVRYSLFRHETSCVIPHGGHFEHLLSVLWPPSGGHNTERMFRKAYIHKTLFTTLWCRFTFRTFGCAFFAHLYAHTYGHTHTHTHRIMNS